MPKFFQFLCLYFLLSGSFFAAGQNVTGVSSTASDGSYKVGDVIPITVEFSEVVNVSGTPQLTLETGSSDAVVNYSSGTGTNTLTFNYTVGSDHSSSDLDYVATSSLALPEPNPGTPVYEDTDGSAHGVTISGNYAYIADETSGLAIIDISDPTNPGTPVYKATSYKAKSVAVSGNYAYVIDQSSGLAIIDISDKANPGSPSYTATNANMGTALAVAVSGNYAYVAASFAGLVIINISDPTSPGTPNYYDTNGMAFGVTVSGNYAYVADRATGLAIFDISNPASPGTPIYVDTNGEARGVAISGNYAYVADKDAGLAIIDISDPTNPGNPVYRDTNGSAYGVTISGNYAYVADGYSGLAIIDISDPTNPGTPVYRDTDAYAWGVTVSGNYAYLSDGYSGLAIIDITDPTNPGTPIYRDTNGAALGVTISGNYAYLADNDSGLAIIDITDPTNPGTPVYRDINGDALRVAISGNYAYLANNDSGLAIIDISDPTNPGTPVYRDTNGVSYGVTVSGNYAYVGNDIAGLAIIPTNAGSINDIAGNAATLVLASPGAANSLGANKAIVVDNTDPTVSNVTSTAANGSYKVGDVIPITIEFSEVVNVTGTPQLTLETGSSDAVVDYSSGTGSNTLTFNYTVASDHTTSDLDYVTTSSFAMNSGTINDAAVNAATLTLASPGASGSLGTNKAIVVDGTVPTMSITANEGIDGFTAEDSTLSLTFASSEAIADFILADITVTGGTISALVAVNDSTYTATFTASGEGAKTILVAVGAYKDVAGNENIAAAQFNWTYDVDNAPQISDTTFSLAENSPNGTFFGTIQASDADGDTLSYTVLSGNTDQAFGLNASTGVLSVTDSTALDYETTPVFSLLVQASDGALSDSATVIINLIDVDEEEEEETLSLTDASAMIYPNPSNGIVNIKMAALKEATIYNLSGKRIMRSTDNRIDVSTLSEGVYIIKLENKSGDRFSTRLIKE